MKLVRKELAKIPVGPCPDCTVEKNTVCILLARIVKFQDDKLLVVTYYNATTRAPHCRVFLTKISYTSYLYATQEWTAKAVNKLTLPDNKGTLDRDWYIKQADEKSLKAAKTFTGIEYRSNTAGIVDGHQYCIRSAKATAENSRREAREDVQLREAFLTLPPLPAKLEQYVRNVPLAKSAYLFYRSERYKDPLTGLRESRYLGFCTSCMQEHELDLIPAHLEYCRCPWCGGTVQARKRGVSRSKLVDTCNIAIRGTGGGAAYIRFFTATRDYRGEPERVRTQFSEREIFRFQDGESLHIARYECWAYGTKYETDVWSVKRTVNTQTKDYWFYPAPEDIWKGTCLEHSQLERYLKGSAEREWAAYPVDYLHTYLKHPNVEHLLQEGLGQFVRDLMWKSDGIKSVDWTKTRPRAMLGVPQAELPRIAELGWGVAELAAYKRVKPLGLILGDEDAEQLIGLLADKYGGVTEVLERTGYERSVRYLRYQQRRRFGGQTHYRDIWHQWMDYRNSAKKLGHNMALEENIFPPDLPKAHDRAAEQLRAKLTKEEEKREKRERAEWKAQYKALLPLCWEADGLLIRPARSQAELTREGDILSHCVAGYGERVKDGDTHILLIRKTEEPDTPYFTLNLSPEGRLIQCHGYKNDIQFPGRIRPESIREFEKKWLKAKVEPWLKAKARAEREKKKKEKQQGAA